MPRARLARFGNTALFQERVAEIGQCIRHELRLIGLRGEQDQVGEALDDAGRKVCKIGVGALEMLLHEIVDVAVQAIGHVSSLAMRRVRHASANRRLSPEFASRT